MRYKELKARLFEKKKKKKKKKKQKTKRQNVKAKMFSMIPKRIHNLLEKKL